MATDNDPDRTAPSGDSDLDRILEVAGAEMLDYVRRRISDRDVKAKLDRILRGVPAPDEHDPDPVSAPVDGAGGADSGEAQDPLDLIARHARPLLWLLACFADAEVPLLLFDPAIMTDSAPVAGLEIRPELLDALAAYRFIEMSRPVLRFRSGDVPADPSPVIRMAAAARDTARRHPEFAANQSAYLTVAASLLLRASEDDPEHPGNWPWWQLVAPHCTFLLHSIHEGLTPDLPEEVVDQVASAAMQAAHYLYARDLPEEADAEFRAILETYELLTSSNTAGILGAREERACILRDRGYLEAAERELRAVYEARREFLSRIPDAAGVLARTDWYSPEGLLLLERDWDPRITRPLLAMIDDYAAIATTLAYRSYTCEDNPDRYKAAAKQAHMAVYQARRRVLGDQHKDTLVARTNVAIRIYNEGLDAGRRDLEEQAEREFRSVYELERKLPGVGEHHLNILAGRVWLGKALQALDRQDEAESELRDVYQLCRQLLGDHHCTTLWAYSSLAAVLYARDAQAAEAYNQAIIASWRQLADRDCLVSHEGQPNLSTRDGLVWALITRGRRLCVAAHDSQDQPPQHRDTSSTAVPTSKTKQAASIGHPSFEADSDGVPRRHMPATNLPIREPQLSTARSGPSIQQ